MARVPLQGVPDVPIASAPPEDYERIQSSPADFGGLTGQAEQKFGADLGQAANKGADVALMFQQRYNEVAGDDAMNNFMKQGDQLTYGNPNDPAAPAGLYQLRGSDALRAGPQVANQLSDLRDQIREQLPNDAVKLQFDQQSRRYYQYKSAEISRHLDQQQQVWSGAVAEAQIDAGVNAAAHAYTNDEAMMHGIADAISGEVKKISGPLGSNPTKEMTDQAQIRGVTKAVSAAVNYAMAADPVNGAVRASQIIARYRNIIDPTVLQELNRRTQGVADEATMAGGINRVMAMPVHPPDPAVVDSIIKSSSDNGVPPDQSLVIAHIESATGTVSDRPGSQYQGVFQMGDNERASVGLASGAPPVEQAAKGAQFVARDYQLASQAVGYPAEGWQTYMVHQQGAKGGVALLTADPGESAAAVLTRAGSPNAAAALSQNGGNPDMTVGQFLGHWQQTYARKAAEIGVTPEGPPPAGPTHGTGAYGMEQQKMLQARQEAERLFPNNPLRQKQMVDAVYQEIAQTNALQAKDDADRQKAKTDYQNAISDQLVTTLLTNPQSFDPATIGQSQLDWEHKKVLTEFAEQQLKRTGIDDTAPYGVGYTKVYGDIFLPPGDPNRINDITDILRRGGPGGDLSLEGVKVLSGIFAASRKNPDQSSDNQSALSLLRYAKGQLLFPGAVSADIAGEFALRDPQGENIYNAVVVPRFLKMVATAERTGDPADVDKVLSRDTIDKMVAPLRTEMQKAKDKLAALGEQSATAPEAPGTKPPPAPPGVNAGEWDSIMTVLPTAQNGQPMSHAVWGQILQRLSADPTAATIQWFDHYLGPQGFDGAELLGRLTKGQIVPAAPGAIIAPALPAPTPASSERERIQRNPAAPQTGPAHHYLLTPEQRAALQGQEPDETPQSFPNLPNPLAEIPKKDEEGHRYHHREKQP